MMNSKHSLLLKAVVMVLFIGSVCSFTCTKQRPPSPAYAGTWKTASARLKVRTKTGLMKYEFTAVEIPVTLTINTEGQASCTLGDLKLGTLNVEPNKGDSTKTGIAYVIDCGEVDKFNATDPLAKKKIALWIKPIGSGKVLQVEVRQMETLDAFPMGELVLQKQ